MIAATLAIQIDASSPPRPTGVAVMVERRVIAMVKIADLRRTLNHIDHLEVAAGHAAAK
jgi:hypothetical protein